MGRRVLIKGTSGAGKTTLAARLARHLGVRHVELDALQHGPNWRQASASELSAAVRAVLDHERGWIVDGNYDSKLGALVLEQAEVVVWLDLPLGITMLRLARRTARRWFRRRAVERQSRDVARYVLGARRAVCVGGAFARSAAA